MIRRLTDSLLAALFAPPCAVCERVLDRPLDGAVCEACWQAIACSSRPFRRAGVISSAAAIGEYDGVLREIIHALKYQARRSTAPRLSALMAQHGLHVLRAADFVVPVPLHPRRERERGFNQADDLAKGLGLPVRRVLRRVKSTQPQVELPAAERHRNVRDAFDVIGARSGGAFRALSERRESPLDFARGDPEPVEGSKGAPPGRTIVLVDDVTTTGATLEACARVLKEAGAAEVRALTAARVASARR